MILLPKNRQIAVFFKKSGGCVHLIIEYFELIDLVVGRMTMGCKVDVFVKWLYIFLEEAVLCPPYNFYETKCLFWCLYILIYVIFIQCGELILDWITDEVIKLDWELKEIVLIELVKGGKMNRSKPQYIFGSVRWQMTNVFRESVRHATVR